MSGVKSDPALEVACSRVSDVLLDQAFFALPEGAFADFTAILEDPPEASDSLRRFLGSKAPWDK